MDEQHIKTEKLLLEKLKGMLHLFQTRAEREAVIRKTLAGLCKEIQNTAQTSEYQDSLCCNPSVKERFLSEFMKFGRIDPLLSDPNIEDIIINGLNPIYAHVTKGGMEPLDIKFESFEELDLLIKKIIIFSGRRELKKINNVELPGLQGRVNIVYSPLGPDLTITNIKTTPLSIIDLINNGSLTSEMAALLWFYMEGLGAKPANIVISGGPGCGKTTLLNALLGFIHSSQHTVVIEDTFELMTPWLKNASRLESDEDLPLYELVKNSLRMRPDRIVIGEVRGKEAEDMATAMNVGKYCLSTIHARTSREALNRLENHPMNIPKNLLQMIDLIVVTNRLNNNGETKHLVSEITELSNIENNTILLSQLWEFSTSHQGFRKLAPCTIFRDRVSLLTGVPTQDIFQDLQRRQRFLEDLNEKGIRQIEEVALFCQKFTDNAGRLYETPMARKADR